MKKALLLTFFCALLFGCGQHPKKAKVHRYVTHSQDAGGNDVILYWYLLSGMNNQYYYYSSPTPVSNYSSVSWSSSTGKPAQLEEDKETIETLEDEEVPVAAIAESEGIEQEQLTETENTETETTTSETESTSDNSASEGNSDSGSDSGGSDSGGGGSDGGGSE